MDSVLISRETLAKRWEISIPTIIKYENDGVIRRVAGVPSPRYNITEITKLEGTDISPLSPLERKRLKQEIETLSLENEKLKKAIKCISIESLKVL